MALNTKSAGKKGKINAVLIPPIPGDGVASSPRNCASSLPLVSPSPAAPSPGFSARTVPSPAAASQSPRKHPGPPAGRWRSSEWVQLPCDCRYGAKPVPRRILSLTWPGVPGGGRGAFLFLGVLLFSLPADWLGEDVCREGHHMPSGLPPSWTITALESLKAPNDPHPRAEGRIQANPAGNPHLGRLLRCLLFCGEKVKSRRFWGSWRWAQQVEPYRGCSQCRALMESKQLPYHWPRTGAEQPLAGSAG